MSNFARPAPQWHNRPTSLAMLAYYIEDYQASVFWMLNPTYQERVGAFVHVNRTGRPQSKNHLAMVLDILAKI